MCALKLYIDKELYFVACLPKNISDNAEEFLDEFDS